MSEERKKFLTQRFGHREEKGTAPTSQRKSVVERRRHSLYLSNDLVERMDKAYKDAAHSLYPVEIDKADFMEACIGFGLDHFTEIIEKLKK